MLKNKKEKLYKKNEIKLKLYRIRKQRKIKT